MPSCTLAMLANCHRDPKKTRPLSPADFNPVVIAKKKRQQPTPASKEAKRENFKMLKTVFVDRVDCSAKDAHRAEGTSL